MTFGQGREAVNTQTSLPARFGTVAERLSVPRLQAPRPPPSITLPGVDQGVFRRLHSPLLLLFLPLHSPLRLAAEHCPCLDFVCCGREKKVCCSSQDTATFYPPQRWLLAPCSPAPAPHLQESPPPELPKLLKVPEFCSSEWAAL